MTPQLRALDANQYTLMTLRLPRRNRPVLILRAVGREMIGAATDLAGRGRPRPTSHRPGRGGAG
eukprot:11875183-Alexandrium_andersonii.AAC.1